jgi:SAM-dependent methyltransferase
VRRVIIELLRCPRCRREALKPEGDAREIVFGPLRCVGCHATYPVADGVADLLFQRAPAGPFQRGMELPWIARSYEQHLRGAEQSLVGRRRVDSESEYLVYKSLLGKIDGDLLDLGCGTGLFARRLATSGDMGAVVGMDVSRPMIEEGVAQAREAGAAIDFLRAQAPELPFRDGSLGAILQAASVHLFAELDPLLREVGRVLAPGGKYVASTYVPPPRLLERLHRRAGLHPRDEPTLHDAVERAGLVRYERVLFPPWIVIRAEKA